MFPLAMEFPIRQNPMMGCRNIIGTVVIFECFNFGSTIRYGENVKPNIFLFNSSELERKIAFGLDKKIMLFRNHGLELTNEMSLIVISSMCNDVGSSGLNLMHFVNTLSSLAYA